MYYKIFQILEIKTLYRTIEYYNIFNGLTLIYVLCKFYLISYFSDFCFCECGLKIVFIRFFADCFSSRPHVLSQNVISSCHIYLKYYNLANGVFKIFILCMDVLL